MDHSKTLRILLADDHKIVRDGLRALLERHANLEVVGEASNGRMALQLARELKPDVVVMDVSMPDLNGVEATQQIMSALPGVRVVALSMHSDRRFVERMFKVGALAYVLKDCAVDELTRAINSVATGRAYLSPGVSDVTLDDVVAAPSKTDPLLVLTAKEREVLQLIAEGYSTKEVAHRLEVSIKTVETHRRNIMAKLKIDNIADLTKFAIREGLTSLGM